MSQKNLKTKLILRLTLGFILILAVFFLLFKNWQKTFIDNFNVFRADLWQKSVKVQQLFNSQDTETLQKNNENLRLQVADLTKALALREQVVRENVQLRSLLNLKVNENYLKKVAYILGPDISLVNALNINLGRVDGVEVGQAIVSGEGALVGNVIEVKDYVSTILLTTDVNSKIAVSKMNSDRVIGLTQGQFGLSISVESIPQTEELNDGDVLVTAGLNSAIPPGLLVGTVQRIVSNENDLFKKAIISPFVDFNTLTLVGVISTK